MNLINELTELSKLPINNFNTKNNQNMKFIFINFSGEAFECDTIEQARNLQRKEGGSIIDAQNISLIEQTIKEMKKTFKKFKYFTR